MFRRMPPRLQTMRPCPSRSASFPPATFPPRRGSCSMASASESPRPRHTRPRTAMACTTPKRPCPSRNATWTCSRPHPFSRVAQRRCMQVSGRLWCLLVSRMSVLQTPVPKALTPTIPLGVVASSFARSGRCSATGTQLLMENQRQRARPAQRESSSPKTAPTCSHPPSSRTTPTMRVRPTRFCVSRASSSDTRAMSTRSRAGAAHARRSCLARLATTFPCPWAAGHDVRQIRTPALACCPLPTSSGRQSLLLPRARRRYCAS